jgi:hypothetical protein
VRQWAADWFPTKIDLRTSSRARLRGVLDTHVLPTFGDHRLTEVSNSAVRAWVKTMSPPTARKAYNALSQMMRAAVADRRVLFNPCADVPVPIVESSAF